MVLRSGDGVGCSSSSSSGEEEGGAAFKDSAGLGTTGGGNGYHSCTVEASTILEKGIALLGHDPAVAFGVVHRKVPALATKVWGKGGVGLAVARGRWVSRMFDG